MPFREWIRSGESNLEMENGGEETVNDTDLCRGHVPSPPSLLLCATRWDWDDSKAGDHTFMRKLLTFSCPSMLWNRHGLQLEAPKLPYQEAL